MKLISRIAERLGYAPAIIAPRVAALAAVVILTRLLSPDEFGLYALVIVYGEMLDSVMLNWTRLGLQRFHHVAGVDLADLRRKAVLLSWLGAALGALVGAALVLSSPGTSSMSFYLMLLLYFLGAGVLRYGLNVLRAQERVLCYVLIECLRPALGLILAWALATYWSASFVAPSLGTFGVTALVAFVVLAFTARSLPIGGSRVPFATFLGYSAPLISVFLVSQLISASDRYLLGAYGGTALVGVYAACTSLARPPIETLFNILNTSAFPRLIKAFECRGEVAAADELRSQLGLLIVIGLPALVGIWLIARPLADLMLDPRYGADSEWIIRLSSLGSFLACLKCFYSDQVFHLRRNSLLQTMTLVPGAAVCVVVCIYAIPMRGGIGAAAGLVAGYGVSATFSHVLAQRHLRVRIPWPLILRASLGCLAMVAVAGLINLDSSALALVFTVAACVAVYVLVCVSTGAVRAIEGHAL
ncbi:lipopolysaccharide biosynthesis protein [Lysobacter arenosi]|uniref:Lipopolysaccharide biosynthesis protein n=1 Tax=Lysobacter arenosi TaxID=2795387 RepID=A0ABX7RGH9_9GAMM|nr:lipopolysaccharide biosynthesis protein [Lysobacter arenosi]QSX76047.1 lipopolysaccharide biosynthesis protein [Lysobacter arenosi]